MRKLMATLALAVAVASTSTRAGAQEVGANPPEFEAVKWYNTPPLALEQLRNKAILVEVFRTW